MSKCLTRPLPEIARYTAVVALICTFLALRFLSFYSRHGGFENSSAIGDPRKPFIIEAECPASRFPSQLNVIRKGMKYPELVSTLRLKLPEEVQNKIDNTRFVNIRFKNESKGTVEVSFYAGRVMDAHFLSDDEAARD
jgi:hypothetical protein